MKKILFLLLLISLIFGCTTKYTERINKNGGVLYDFISAYNEQDISYIKNNTINQYLENSGLVTNIKQEYQYFENINISFIINNYYEKNNIKIFEIQWDKNGIVSTDSPSYLSVTYGNTTNNNFTASGITVFELKKLNNDYKLSNISGDKIFGL